MTVEFAEFYHANYRPLARQLYAYLGDHAEAQDLVQEAFCRAFDRWARISEYHDPVAWVRKVAWNLATSRLRRIGVARRHMLSHREEHAPGPGPDRVALVGALARLPERHRVAVVSHYIGQLSTAEIAAQEGVAEGTVRSWLSRGRAELAQYFDEFNTGSDRLAPPPGVQAVTKTVKRRRRLRIAAATVIAALVISAPVVLLALNRDSTPPPPITPSPSVSPSPSTTSLADALSGRGGQIQFVSAVDGWALSRSDGCDLTPSPTCTHTLFATNDGGKSWRRILLESLNHSGALLYARDAKNVVIHVTEESASTSPSSYVFFSNDGGGSFRRYSPNEAPKEALLTSWFNFGEGGEYRVLCPGYTGLEPALGAGCGDNQQLTRLGVGPVSQQPKVGSLFQAHQGADGRVWVLGREGERTRIAVSTDDAKTWRELPSPPKGPLPVDTSPRLFLSPDGKDVWYWNGPEVVLFWDGNAWKERGGSCTGVPTAYDCDRQREPVAALGDETLVIYTPSDRSISYVHNGTLTKAGDIPAADSAYATRDAALIVTAWDERTIYIGAGSGVSRQWTAVVW